MRIQKSQVFLVLLLFLSLRIFSQDVVKVMQYNLLNYGNTTSYCTTTNNAMADKEQYLKTIIDYTLPDVFCVNEMGANSYVAGRILDSVMNNNGRVNYKKSSFTNNSGGYLVNMMYYNSYKFAMDKELVINTLVRDINLYRLYYKDPQLAQTKDTAFVVFIVAHLKAGSSSSDKQTRATMTQNAMNYITQNLPADNYLFMGDFNIKSHNEQSYQNLLNPSNSIYKFNDPINSGGSWNNNSSYKSIHTQSTHSSSNGCASSGGMDDRFDLILISNSIKNGSNHYTYKQNSYEAFGNDGNHFNSSINSGSNNSAPQNIINALYNLSDHLPVILELDIDQSGANSIASLEANFSVTIQNPVKEDLQIKINSQNADSYKIEIYNNLGQKYLSKKITNPTSNKNFLINTDKIPTGLLFVKISNNSEQSIIKKIIKL